MRIAMRNTSKKSPCILYLLFPKNLPSPSRMRGLLSLLIRGMVESLQITYGKILRT
jgi:hypothetical protein